MSAADDGVDGDSFYVLYHNVSGDSQYVDGALQRSIFVVERLCAFTSSTLDDLSLIIQHEGGEIAATFKRRLTALFLNGDNSESTDFSVYIDGVTEFSLFYIAFFGEQIE